MARLDWNLSLAVLVFEGARGLVGICYIPSLILLDDVRIYMYARSSLGI